ncbi:MAG: UPF0182 family protein, partial [Candidatus Binataceae bacterium]
SKVLLGNLLVIPIEDALLYVEPLYIRAANGQLPELKRVIASFSDRIVMGDDLESTLAKLFKGEAPLAAVQVSVPGPAAGATAAGGAGVNGGVIGLSTAADHYQRALDALKQGDWPRFGAEMQSLGSELARPPNSTSH